MNLTLPPCATTARVREKNSTWVLSTPGRMVGGQPCGAIHTQKHGYWWMALTKGYVANWIGWAHVFGAVRLPKVPHCHSQTSTCEAMKTYDSVTFCTEKP